MKKLFGSVMLLALLVVVSGCGDKEAATPYAIPSYHYEDYKIGETLKDGEYKEMAQGRNGDFEVAVTIKEGKLAKVSVGDNQETEDVGGVALKELAQKITESKTPNVDSITGASISSFALKDAVSRALEKASEVK